MGHIYFIEKNIQQETLLYWEIKLGLYRNCLYNRLNVYGWTLKNALTIPSKKK